MKVKGSFERSFPWPVRAHWLAVLGQKFEVAATRRLESALTSLGSVARLSATSCAVQRHWIRHRHGADLQDVDDGHGYQQVRADLPAAAVPYTAHLHSPATIF